MSKNWFHYCLKDKNHHILFEGQIDNTPEAIYNFINFLFEELESDNLEQIILCMEHTGIYVQHLTKSWLSLNGKLSLIHANKISDLLAGHLGWEDKNDCIDARRIAEYGIRYSDQLKMWQLQSESLNKLQRFQRQRDRFLKVISLLEVPLNESKKFDENQISKEMEKNQKRTLKALKQDLKDIETKLKIVIDQDPVLKNLFALIKSVEGVGPVTAREIIITTGAFTKFTPDQPKKYARYAGVVPLRFNSGSSVRKKSKTSERANKKIKSLLTNGATSLINTSNELAQYYERKTIEGKKHLVIINAMRNKIIHRVFSVVRNQVMYEKNLNQSLT